ncbi:MAG TPA: hypothetical protein VHH90_10300 [Polyangia bacterium]|nr:hypothetical protein [Polyangia bacterium]
MRKFAVAFAYFIALGLAAGAAHAEPSYYVSRHPLPKRVGHGFCDIDVPHFHDYPPSDPRLYRAVGGQYYFVGDPTPFGYDGPRYSFYGPHPVADANVTFGTPTYCYLNGPHYHWYAPPPTAQFEMRGGAYWYVGAYEPVFYAERPRFVVVNEVYAPLAYERPIIDVAIAPPAFRGEIMVGGPGWMGGPRGWREGPAWHGGPEHREMVMHERHEEWRHEEHRGWQRGPGWHGGPEQDRGWHGAPGAAPGHDRGWHGGPGSGPTFHGAGAQPGPGFHGGGPQPHGQAAFQGGGAPAPRGGGGPHGGFHR